MSGLLAILCSPRKQGVSDRLAESFARGFMFSGQPVNFLAFRDYHIIPCEGCQYCMNEPCVCRLAARDSTEELFKKMSAASLLLFSSPIYFYALPAHFKGFIDRGQLFYAKKIAGKHKNTRTLPPAISIFCAARKKGKELFSGAERTLRYFLQSAESRLLKSLVFRGLDKPKDIKPHIFFQLMQTGWDYGRKFASERKMLSP